MKNSFQSKKVEAVFDNAVGREVIKFSSAFVFHSLATYTDHLPYAKIVKSIAKQQMTISSFKVVSPYLGMMKGVILEFVQKTAESLQIDLKNPEDVKRLEQTLGISDIEITEGEVVREEKAA